MFTADMATGRGRVARFFLALHTKTGKNYQKDQKIFKMITEYANDLKKYQMAEICTKMFHSKAFQNTSK
jgi:hypothetical protein